MHVFKHTLVLALSFILSMSGCKKDNNPVWGGLPFQSFSSQSLYGQVIDSYGRAVEGCGVHYIYAMTTSPLAKTGTALSSTEIEFILPARSKVTLKILRWYTRDEIATLVDDTLDGGAHAVTFDATKITNGIYIYQLKAGTLLQEKYMSLLVDDLPALVNTAPVVATDYSGSFQLPLEVFGFNVPFTRVSESGTPLETVYVSHTIQMVIYKPGYTTVTKTMTIDEAKNINQTFTLIKQ